MPTKTTTTKMSQSPSPQNAALVAHIAQQTRANLDFLVAQDYLSASEASSISRSLGRLSSDRGALNSSDGDLLSDRAQNLALNDRPPSRTQAARRSVPPPPRQAPAPSQYNQARALWDYNGDVRTRILSGLKFVCLILIAFVATERSNIPRGRYHRHHL